MSQDDSGDGLAESLKATSQARSAPQTPSIGPRRISTASAAPSRGKASTLSKKQTPLQAAGTLVKNACRKTLQNIAKYNPLLAAVSAPLSTLLDIPALSQSWYSLDDKPIPDRRSCIALSSTSLTLNIVANILLLVRFSNFQGLWQRAADLSVVFWFLKTAVALCNLFIFGAAIPRPPGSQFSEGFWCAVLSVIIAGLIAIALFLHYLLGLLTPLEGDLGRDLRLTGRKFLLSVTAFVVLIGLEALAFSQLEKWKYTDAIYFSMQTALTVGYGDLTAHTAAGKILTFIFAALTLCQLGNIVSITIDWVQSREVERRQEWMKNYSIAIHRSAVKRKPHATLIDEIALLHQISLHQETLIQLYDLAWSLSSMFAFWCLGALVFHYIEGWGYGNGLYMVMVMSFTIGYGDFTPVTAAGRVVWIVYALMAVPVVTNFATQTVTGILYTITEHQFTNDVLADERDKDPEVFAPHSHFVLRHHHRWEKIRRLYLDTLRGEYQDETALEEADEKDEPPSSQSHSLDEKAELQRAQSEDIPKSATHESHRKSVDVPDSLKPDKEDKMVDKFLEHSKHPSALEAVIGHAQDADPATTEKQISEKQAEEDPNGDWLRTPFKREQIEFYLLKQLIGRVTRLEAQARQMMIDSMDKSLAQTLLVADRNLQIRDAFQLYGKDDDDDEGSEPDFGDEWEDEHNRGLAARAEHLQQLEQETNLVSGDSFDDNMLERVRRYRSAFAEILVLCSTLLGLEGDDLKRFERWHIQLEGGGYEHHRHQRFSDRGTKRGHRGKHHKHQKPTRDLDTDGRIRPADIAAPGDRDPPDDFNVGGHDPLTDDDSTPSNSVSPSRHLHRRRHRHRKHSPSRSRSAHPSSKASGSRSPAPHSHRRNSHSSTATGGGAVTADQAAGVKTAAAYAPQKPRQKRRWRDRVWDVMEDELFRRTDKNVEDIISEVPEEEKQEYLSKEAFARELLLTTSKQKRQEDERLKKMEREVKRGRRREKRADRQDNDGSGSEDDKGDKERSTSESSKSRRHREAALLRQARTNLDDVWNTMNAGPDHLRPYVGRVQDESPEDQRRGRQAGKGHGAQANADSRSHRSHHHRHRHGHTDQGLSLSPVTPSTMSSAPTTASPVTPKTPRYDGDTRGRTIYALPADGQNVYRQDPSDAHFPKEINARGSPFPPLKQSPLGGWNIV